MSSLPDRLTQANVLLAPYAVPHDGLQGRVTDEPEDETRFPFQRDRDRIIHAQAFRRLQGKTQVFVAGEGDHYRTRLTHTMEVAQIARDIARTLRLNEDLCECIALSHDLGHPPFGHAGEAALDAWMRGHGSSFEHNEQSLRIVMLLENHSTQHPGLNLHRDILDGLQKHGMPDGLHRLMLEAQTVDLADEIAYTGHDAEDGLEAGLFTQSDLTNTALGTAAIIRATERGTSIRGAIIHLLITDLYAATDDRLRSLDIQTVNDVLRAPERIVTFSEGMRQDIRAFRAFLTLHMYNHPRVRDPGDDGKQIIQSLCDAYMRHPTEKILELQVRTNGTLAEAVKDYVAGMTDGFARNSQRR